MAYDSNPLKEKFSIKYIRVIQQTLDGFHKPDPTTKKMIPIKQLLVKRGLGNGSYELGKATGDWVLIAFYFCFG
ncbi:hypothetical protein ACHAW6_012981 [Cyclotella cf. meneghiniana]